MTVGPQIRKEKSLEEEDQMAWHFARRAWVVHSQYPKNWTKGKAMYSFTHYCLDTRLFIISFTNLSIHLLITSPKLFYVFFLLFICGYSEW